MYWNIIQIAFNFINYVFTLYIAILYIKYILFTGARHLRHPHLRGSPAPPLLCCSASLMGSYVSPPKYAQNLQPETLEGYIQAGNAVCLLGLNPSAFPTKKLPCGQKSPQKDLCLV